MGRVGWILGTVTLGASPWNLHAPIFSVKKKKRQQRLGCWRRCSGRERKR